MWGEELTCEQVHHHDNHHHHHHDQHHHDHHDHDRQYLEQDVWDVFGNYIGQKVNKAGVKVERTPWCDGNMSRETSLIADKLSQVQLSSATQSAAFHLALNSSFSTQLSI